jgi:hypothetical protein
VDIECVVLAVQTPLEDLMDSLLKNDPSGERSLSLWSQLPDIETITDCLSAQDRAFLENVGAVLREERQTSRFAVTLLHSHFEVRSDECLVEAFDSDRRYLITTVEPLAVLNQNEEIVVKSWKFREDPPETGVENLQVLTWSRRSDIPQAPLNDSDVKVIHHLADLFRTFEVSNLFGMALVGQLPDNDKIWTEGTDFLGRRLVQEQLSVTDVEARNPIKTMWVFDEEGKYLITLGCCLRTRDGKSHTGSVHPAGR